MKKLVLIAVFAMVSGFYSTVVAQENKKHKEVRVEKEIENGKEKTRVWVNGKEVKENSKEYKKYAEGEMATGGDVKVKKWKQKGKEGDNEEKVIIIKKRISEDVIVSEDDEMEIDVDVKEDGENHKVIIKKKGKDGQEEIEEIIIDGSTDNAEIIGKDGEKMMFIRVEEDVDVEVDTGDEETIDVDVTSGDKGKRKVIIKKKTKDGKVEVKEMMIDDNGEEVIQDGDTKVIIKTKKEVDGDKDVKIIRKKKSVDKEFDMEFDLDGLDPEDIKTIDIDKTENGKTIIIKTKDGKTIVKNIENGSDTDVKVIKKKRVKKEKN